MKDAHFFRPRNKSLHGAQEGGEMNICFDIPTSCYSSVYLFGQFKMKILVVGPMIPLPRRAATEVASSTTKCPVHTVVGRTMSPSTAQIVQYLSTLGFNTTSLSRQTVVLMSPTGDGSPVATESEPDPETLRCKQRVKAPKKQILYQ